MNLQKLQLENEMLKQLVAYGEIYVNYHSSDCDGGHSGGHLVFQSIEELYKWEEDKCEWADGPFGWTLTTPQELEQDYRYFTR